MAVQTCLLALFLAIAAGSVSGYDKWSDDYHTYLENSRKNAERLIIIYVSVGIGVFVVTTIVVFSCLCCKGCPFYMRHKRSSPGIIFSSNTQPAIVTTQSPHSMPSPPPYYTHPGFVYQQQHNPYQEYQYQSLQQEQQQSIPYHTNLQQQDLLQQQYHQHQEVQNQQR